MKEKIKNKLFKINSIVLLICFSFSNYAISINAFSIKKEIPSLAPMLEKVLPTVVSIHVSGSTKTYNQQLPEEFKFFFGPNFPPQQNIKPFKGLGSGVIIDSEKGYILTNNHVIDHATKIQIQLNNGKEIDIKLIGKDQQTDIALLQIEDTNKNNIKKLNLKAIKIADSDQIKVGDFAVAVGNPFGIGQTATLGIISALGRSGLNIEGFENFIQTDASINRGNSGGALVNLNGELIGINTAILAPEGGNIGIGFAIPSNMATSLSNQIMKYGSVKRGILGIKGTEMNSDIAKALKIDTQRGAFVNEVIPNSAAYKANIQAGDIIISINEKPINSFSELRAKIGTSEAGQQFLIGLVRKGQIINVKVVLEDIKSNEKIEKINNTVLLGAQLSNGFIKNIKGVKVDDVPINSKAEALGLQKNDLIINANEKRTENINQFKKIIESKPNTLAVNIIRGNQNIYLLLRENMFD